MSGIYNGLTSDAKLALDAYDAAVYLYECAHTEPNRQARDAAREAMLREVRASFASSPTPCGTDPR